MENKENKAAVICSSGIGDGLLMMVASHRLFNLGFEVTTYHNALNELQDWFPDHQFKKLIPISEYESEFSPYTLVIVQNDNSKKVKTLISLYKEKKIPSLSIFYPTYEKGKHAPRSPLDQVFDSSKPMVDNIARAISALMKLSVVSKNNGINFPEDTKFRFHKRRVVIHPTSAQEQKNWPKEKYFKLANLLKEKNYEPVFAVSPNEHNQWIDAQKEGFELPFFPTLSSIAKFIAESGYLVGNDSALVHLASNFHVPTVVISDSAKRMRLWRPGWLAGMVITPWRWIPNIKRIRFRENKWKRLISVRKVARGFIRIASKNHSSCK